LALSKGAKKRGGGPHAGTMRAKRLKFKTSKQEGRGSLVRRVVDLLKAAKTKKEGGVYSFV